MSVTVGAIVKGIKIVTATVSATKTGKKHKGLVAVLLIVLILIPVIAVVAVISAPLTLYQAIQGFFEGSGLTNDEINVIISDAGLLRDYMKKDEFEPFKEELLFIDADTVIRILDAVDDYNKTVTKPVTITYEYRVETGSYNNLPKLDYETGELEVPDEKEDAEEEPDADEETDTSGEEADEKESSDDAQADQTVYTPYSVSYEEDSVTLKRVDIDLERRGGKNYEDVFYMEWQPVVALCSMFILQNSENWGIDYVDGSPVFVGTGDKHYYLSDSDIDAVIDIFAYDYTYLKDITKSSLLTVKFDDFYKNRGSGFQLNIVTNDLSEGNVEKVERITKRIPSIAPLVISNTYTKFEYNYITLKDGSKRLKNRTFTAQPSKLVDAFYENVEGFSENLFLYILGLLPQTEDQVEYYKNTIFAENNEVIYTYTTEIASNCPAIGTVVAKDTLSGSGNNNLGDAGGLEIAGDDYIIPLYGIDGWGKRYLKPGEWIVKEGNSYGSFGVSAAAMGTLRVSDELSKTQIEKCLKNFPFSKKILNNSPLLANDQAIKDTADCLYQYQESTGTSVCGILAIMYQEGGFASTITTRGWNFFNITVSTGYKGIPGYERFRDYKTDYENKSGLYQTKAVNAFAEQVGWINDRYWQKGQDSYYLMCFNGYDYSNPGSAYQGISHSYCPPWDDQAMPYSPDSYTIYNDGSVHYYWKNANERNTGWVNGCARARSKFAQYM